MKRYFNTAIALGLLLVSSLTFADRDNNHRNNGNGREHHNNFVNQHNNSRGNDWRRDDRADYRDNRWNRRDNDYDENWSINLNIGSRPFGYNPYGYNMQGYRGQPLYRSNQPTVIYQNNTYIGQTRPNTYIRRPAPTTGYTTHETGRPGVSLLRDRSGRCYEREIDRFGNETRTELRSSECNF